MKVNSINSRSYPIPELGFPGSGLGAYSVAGDARKLFGSNLKRFLKRQGYSPSGLADYLSKRFDKEVKPQMVSRWSRGGTLPTKYLNAIADYCDVDIHELFSPIDPKPKPEISPDDAMRVLARSRGFVVRRLKNPE